MTAPVFIEVPNYRQVLDHVDAIKAHLFEAQRLVKEIDALRSEESEHIQSTRVRLSHIKQSLRAVEEDI